MIFASDPIHTIENLIHKYKTRSFSIYIIVVLGLTAFIGSLPFVYIDISSQSRGIIRSISTIDNANTILVMEEGKIVELR
jgi:membrane fusion protein, peptide pheromone/bacteriocin exporter